MREREYVRLRYCLKMIERIDFALAKIFVTETFKFAEECKLKQPRAVLFLLGRSSFFSILITSSISTAFR